MNASDIHQLTFDGQTEKINELLSSQSVSVDQLDEESNTALHYASSQGNLNLVQLLLNFKSNPNIPNKFGSTSLHEAARSGKKQVLQLLLDEGGDLSRKDEEGWNALHYSILSGDAETVSFIIERGGDVNGQTNEKDNSLHIASSRGNLEIMSILIESGASLLERNNSDCTPLSLVPVSETPFQTEFPSLVKRGNALSQSFRGLINNQQYSDVSFALESGESVYGHKVILCTRCPYLKKLIEENESNHQFGSEVNLVISIPEISTDSFLAIIEYLYTGTVSAFWMMDGQSPSDSQLGSIAKMVQNSNFLGQATFLALDLMNYCERFELEDLQSICENVIIYCVDPKVDAPTSNSNIRALIDMAGQPNHSQNFLHFCANYVASNFNIIASEGCIPEVSSVIGQIIIDLNRQSAITPSSSLPSKQDSKLMTQKNQQKCSTIVRNLLKDLNSWPFAEPVDPIALNIPDYFQIIKHPMDLGTVRNNLEAGKYTTVTDWISDMRLIFSNALTYNPPDHDVTKMAILIKAQFESKLAQTSFDKSGVPAAKPGRKSIVGGIAGEISRTKSQTSLFSSKSNFLPFNSVNPTAITGHTAIMSVQPLTNDEKRRITEAIASLSSDGLVKAVEILSASKRIRLFESETTEGTGEPADVLDVDLDEVDDVFLRRLEKLLVQFIPGYQSSSHSKENGIDVGESMDFQSSDGFPSDDSDPRKKRKL